MKLENVIAFTQYMQSLVADSDIFLRCSFIADDSTMRLGISVNYHNVIANGGVCLYGSIFEEVSYEEFMKDDFDVVKLGDEMFSKLKEDYYTNIN